MAEYLPFLIILMILAAILREDAVLMVFYLVGGVYLLNYWWNRKVIKSVTCQRIFTNRAFLGEKVPVRVDVSNTSSLPSFWLLIHDSLPSDLIAPNFSRRVVQLRGHGRASLEYTLNARKRGFYLIGPAFVRSGDFFGLANETERQVAGDNLIVYPQIVPLRFERLPSNSPHGTLRYNQPIYEDPTRIGGKRPYQPGDSLRRMDWKTTAAAGELTIKQYQPSIALESWIFLDLYGPDYELRTRIHSTELGIVTAASLGNWIVTRKQTLGFATNGTDPLAESRPFHRIPSQKGRTHLMRILDLLARIDVGTNQPLPDLLREETPYLAWGATALIITGRLDEAVFDELFQARRRGADISIILVGQVPNASQAIRQAEQFGFPTHLIASSGDLETWR